MQGLFPILVNRATNATTVEHFAEYKAKDWVLIAMALVVLILYEGFFLVVYYFSPQRCTLHRNITNKTRWIEGILRKKGSEILVVQSLRNGILAANFFATTSATIGLFSLGQVYNSIVGVAAAQLYAIGICLFLSFLNWLIVIRNYNHLTFHHYNEVEDSLFQENEMLKRQFVRMSTSLMSRATVHHYLGTRCFYLIIVIFGWKISPVGMLSASFLLVPWLAYHDFA